MTFTGLSTREQQVAERLCQGAKNREIADELGISIKTVDCHRTRIMRKLRTRNNVELLLLAIRNGWLSVPLADEVVTGAFEAAFREIEGAIPYGP